MSPIERARATLIDIRISGTPGEDVGTVVLSATDADAILSALTAAGFVIVPKEPTPEMLHAATMEVPTWDDDASRRKWRAMLSASQGGKTT